MSVRTDDDGDYDVGEWLRAEANARCKAWGSGGQGAKGKFETFAANPDRQIIGLVGEAEFSNVFGVPMNLTRGKRDGGFDFIIPFGFSVDVKTSAAVPAELVVPCDKVTADIYVLAGYVADRVEAILVGWEWATALRRVPAKQMPSGMCHVIGIDDLREMADLEKRVMRLRCP